MKFILNIFNKNIIHYYYYYYLDILLLINRYMMYGIPIGFICISNFFLQLLIIAIVSNVHKSPNDNVNGDVFDIFYKIHIILYFE